MTTTKCTKATRRRSGRQVERAVNLLANSLERTLHSLDIQLERNEARLLALKGSLFELEGRLSALVIASQEAKP